MQVFSLECSFVPSIITETNEVIEIVQHAESLFFAQCSHQLRIVPYTGIASPLSGGRTHEGHSLEKVAAAVSLLNGAGIPFSLAVNGGLSYSPQLHANDVAAATDIFHVLSDLSNAHNVRNSVIITHPGLLPVLRKNFPMLRVIASCIQQLNSLCPETYAEKCGQYDAVVVLNQHAWSGALSHYEEQVLGSLIVLLKSGCAQTDLYTCYEHYVETEHAQSAHAATAQYLVSRTEFNVSPPVLKGVASGCWDRECGPEHFLINRREELVRMVELGIRQFKIQRENDFQPREDLPKLIEAVQDAHKALS